MQFQVTAIEFDFDDIDEKEQDEIYEEVYGQIWEADDKNDLVEEIATAYGWNIKSLDYRHILK